MLTAAHYRISSLIPERFKLDGGAMFGSVPKTLWQKRIVPDELNRIQLACRVLVLESDTRKILVDLGNGNKWLSKEKSIYSIEYLQSSPIQQAISGVTDIILTHLHFDHAGGITYLNENSTPELSFPEARVYLQGKNLTHAKNPGIRERASYLSENVAPLAKAKLILTEDAEEILPYISVFQVNGHTHGMQWVLIGSGSDAVAYPADLVPTAHHISIPYVMGYDMCAETTMREKEYFLTQAALEKWRIVFEHDAEVSMGRVAKDEKGNFVLSEKLELPDYFAATS